MLVFPLLLALLVGGCSSNKTTSTPQGTGAAASSTPSPSSSAGASATDCPTENTASFAKTRFVADLGGSIFLVNRYLIQPYRAGSFTKGASGRTVALIKATAAAAATVKLLNNAKANAKANPTLCKTVAGPIGQVADQISGLAGSLRSGSVAPGVIGGLAGLVTGIQQKAGAAGVAVPEKQVPLG